MKKAISIEIRWDDGSISKAEGEAAAEIMNWYGGCESMNLVHGAVYRGRHFTVIPPPAASTQSDGGKE